MYYVLIYDRFSSNLHAILFLSALFTAFGLVKLIFQPSYGTRIKDILFAAIPFSVGVVALLVA